MWINLSPFLTLFSFFSSFQSSSSEIPVLRYFTINDSDFFSCWKAVILSFLSDFVRRKQMGTFQLSFEYQIQNNHNGLSH